MDNLILGRPRYLIVIVFAIAVGFLVGYSACYVVMMKKINVTRPTADIDYSLDFSIGTEALKPLEEMARKGNADGIAMLYNYYLYERSNKAKADQMVQWGAENGNASDQIDFAEVNYNAGNKKTALKWIMAFDDNVTSTNIKDEWHVDIYHSLKRKLKL